MTCALGHMQSLHCGHLISHWLGPRIYKFFFFFSDIICQRNIILSGKYNTKALIFHPIIIGYHICCSFILLLTFNSCLFLVKLKIEWREQRSKGTRNVKEERRRRV